MQFTIPLDRILTDNNKEYTTRWRKAKHEYEKFLKENKVIHAKIKQRIRQSNWLDSREI